VHRTLGEQFQNRCPHVAALAASAAASAATGSATWAEPEAGSAAGTETAEAGATETGTSEAAAASACTSVLTDVVAEVAPGLPALLVQLAAVGGAESGGAESKPWLALERAFVEWGVHGLSP
jgi:hypothetical protein